MFTFFILAVSMMISTVLTLTVFFNQKRMENTAQKVEKSELLLNNTTMNATYPAAEEKMKNFNYQNLETFFSKVCYTVWTTAKRNYCANADSVDYVWSFLGTAKSKKIDDILSWAYTNSNCSAAFDCSHPENYACYLIRQAFPNYPVISPEVANITVSVNGTTTYSNPCGIGEILIK